MALDFPATPADGQLYSGANGVLYQWSASKGLWLSTPQAIQNLGLADFIAYGSGATMAPPSAGVWFPIKPPTILTGNSGSWYNSTTGRFTPPAGRYRLFAELTFNSSGQSIQGLMRWTKNGATILPSNSDSSQDTPAANKFGSVTSETIIDANGTDYFECHVQSWTVLFSVAYGYIGAMPLGVVVAMNNGWRLLSRQVAGAAVADFQFRNLPSDINNLMFSFDVTPSANAQDFIIQLYDAANTLVSANYGGSVVGLTHSQASGSAPGVIGSVGAGITNCFFLTYAIATRRVYNLAPMSGRGAIENIRAVGQKYFTFQANYVSDDANQIVHTEGGGRNSGTFQCTGLRFLFGSGNMVAGSTVSLWGSP